MTAADFVAALPKTELHVHLEGTLEPEDLVRFAARNGVELPWRSPDEVRAAYSYTGLDEFLRLYYLGCTVLHTRADFHELTAAYLRRAAADGVRRAEMFVSPQSFLGRVAVADVLGGVLDAIADARTDLGVDGAVLVIAQRHRTEAEALELLDAVAPWQDSLLGVGLGGAELGNPPSRFARFFADARRRGYRLTCHAGEEGPAGYVREALDCGVERIDHGIAAADDPALVARLRDEGVPLTMCPLSNLRLRVVDDLAGYPIMALHDAGVVVSVNSDDPPYFGGYVADNHRALAEHLGLSTAQLAALARSGFRASFAPADEIAAGVAAVEDHEARAAGSQPNVADAP
ncbi:adenosine deaminase [Pseudonocardia sp. N23]|uniref:adenosine deaminase n=1 Tax=Pseudonocardia sp. N23 TaxID=1987376 RepID=UPI000BFC05FF|nr:adenosine deaminase [Pseudonocardia sp. N23]GAY07966.1 adenosine deaminase [Pseudonocardia sp. N23]